MKKYCFSVVAGLIAGVSISSCTSNEVLPEDKRSGAMRGADNKFQSPQPFQGKGMLKMDPLPPGMNNNINDYARGVMHQLISNLQYVNNQTPIGVSSFVFLDSNLKQTSLLGYQLAESFVHEIHQIGIPVIDFKTMDFIRVTAQGDFIFSRDFLELQSAVPIQYILTGTLTKHQRGYLVNARIIGLVSKAVVASAQGFIPNRVVDSLISNDGTDGISLSRRP